MKKMYLAKYALSSGIKEVTAEESRDYEGFFYIDKSFTGYKIGRDIFCTREEAVDAANTKKAKRIASLEKQIAKLERLTF